MIQIVGLLVAVYAVARLLQAPIEHSAHHRKDIWLWVIALVGIMGIGLLSFVLLFATLPGLSSAIK